MTWVLILLIAAAVFGVMAFVLKLPRSGWEITGAALLFGIAGYALQGHPGQAGAPHPAAESAKLADAALLKERQQMGTAFGKGQSWLVLADALTRQGQFGAAAEVLHSAIAKSPKDADLWVALGNALVGHSDGMITPAAQFAFQKAADIAPDHPGPPFFMGLALAQTGRLSDAAMDRALGALRICADKLRRRNVRIARSVATEACRRAENGADFVARVRAETGIVLEVISAGEEARLAVMGCHALLEPGEGPALIFDIGGGSTELVLIEGEGPLIRDWVSVPWGVVSLSEMSGPEAEDGEGRIARYDAMRARVADSFAGFAARVAGAAVAPRLLGTSGTVTTLASVHLALPQYDRAVVDGAIVPATAMRAISTRLSAMSLAERRELPCIGRERADLVVAGCAILESILDLWPADRLGVADRGIREGILRGLLRGATRPAGAEGVR